MRKIKAFQEKGGDISKLPPPPRSDYSHYVECKYCGRNYAPEVAERHIPKCANIINKPGGIKPSNIQSKYVNGTGSQGMKSTSSGLKPGISSITKTTVTSSAIKPPIIASTVKSATKPVMASKIFVKRWILILIAQYIIRFNFEETNTHKYSWGNHFNLYLKWLSVLSESSILTIIEVQKFVIGRVLFIDINHCLICLQECISSE